ncbi:MAG: hypothetical protein HY689_02500 [Chloroflexi bacterium]|nr:hypothetical protein [Chloroflexota bacterium]
MLGWHSRRIRLSSVIRGIDVFAMKRSLQAYSYQSFLDELSRGKHFGVFIDDTASPGLATHSAALHPDRKSWVGVVVPSYQMPEVLEQFPRALEELGKLVGAREFHFADIYAGRGEFKDIPFPIRLALFRFMAHLIQAYQFPIFVQIGLDYSIYIVQMI